MQSRLVGDKEIKSGELTNQINIGVISTEGIELKKKKYLPCKRCSITSILNWSKAIFQFCKKCNANNSKTKVSPDKTPYQRISSKNGRDTLNLLLHKKNNQWTILKQHLQINSNDKVDKDKQDHSMHNNTPSNFKWIRPKLRERCCKNVTEWFRMVLIEIFVIGITLASFPLCGLFLILYLSNYKKNEKKV